MYCSPNLLRGNGRGNINGALLLAGFTGGPPGALNTEKRAGRAPRPAARDPSIARAPPGAVLLGMFALNDAQLALVMTAAGSLPVEKRSVFLERVAARLWLHGPRFTDADLGAAIQAALTIRGLTR